MVRQYGNGNRLAESEREAIDKRDFEDFEQKRIRGTGYEMMRIRDRGFGSIPNLLGGEVTLEWNIDSAEYERPEYAAVRNIPANCFLITVGGKEALIEREVFLKLFRWV